MDKFAVCPFDMTEPAWAAALTELQNAGHPIRWVAGQVLDDPTITGGWVLEADLR